MANYSLIDLAGKIVNRIVLDDNSPWTPPDGLTTVRENGSPLEIGGTYKNGVYTPPPVAEIPPPSAAQVTEAARVATFRSDANRTAMLTRLQNANSAQIDAWVTANVTTLAEARTALGIILKLIATDSRQ